MAKRANCRCEEAYILGIRSDGDVHDCDYIEARNKLMAAAEARASKLFNSYSQKSQWAREFHKAMNYLAYETELTKFPPRPEGVEYVVPVKLDRLRLKKFGA